MQDRIDLELPGIIERKYDVIYMSAQKLVAELAWSTAIWWAPVAVLAPLWWPFMSGITEVNSLAAPLPLPQVQALRF